MTDFKSQKIKKVIKTLLKKREITYEDLAERLECSVPTVTRILGQEEMTLTRLLEFCEILAIDLAEIEALTKDSEEKEERFTPEQETFLAKNKNYFAYLMKLFEGFTPKQIAEKFGLSQRSTDKYLIGLEKHALIRVTGKQRVKPAFKSFPSLGRGQLGDAFYESMIRNSAQFFIERARESMRAKPEELELHSAKFGLNSVKISKASYDNWMAELKKVHRDFTKLADYEEKSKDPSELVTAVIMDANTLVPSDYKKLSLIEDTFGEVTNF